MHAMNPQVQRAQLLIQQSRFDLAERELRGSLAGDPEDWLSHAMLAFALLRQGKAAAAMEEARAAIGYQPDAPYAHYVLALACLESDKRKEARAAARQAKELDPEDPDFHSLLGWMDLEEKRWQDALENAEKGLSLDPEHVQSANVRAQALVKLGRGAEAGTTLGTTLSREPESALTHANMGWTLLESGEHRRALEHFRESLRLVPTLEWAREGIVEAMKARNFFYRIMLRYFFWMGKLQAKAQWVLILGAIFGLRFLRSMSEGNPGFEPIATGISAVYIVFLAATWLARPLFDLLLRIDSFGRLCLSEDQVKGSNWLGATLALAVGFLGVNLATQEPTYLAAAIGSLALCLPVSGIFQVRNPGRRRVHAAYAVGLALCGVGALILPDQGPKLGALFLGGIIAYTWFANLYK
jgi:tetratricopeptide (TPR) repeat protein